MNDTTDTTPVEITGGYIIANAEIILRGGSVRHKMTAMRWILRHLGESIGVDFDPNSEISYYEESDCSSDLGRVFAFKICREITDDQVRSLAYQFLMITRPDDSDREIIATLEESGEQTMGIIGGPGVIPAVAFTFHEGYGDYTYDPYKDLITSLYLAVSVTDTDASA